MELLEGNPEYPYEHYDAMMSLSQNYANLENILRVSNS